VNIRNTPHEYGLVSKLLHWLIAVLVMALIPIGWYMSGLSNESVLYWRMLDLHVMLGLCVLTLFVIKAGWRLVSPNPPLAASLSPWESRIARIVHGFFLIALAVIPVTGFLYLTSNGEPTSLFNIVEIPEIGEWPKAVRRLVFNVHMVFAYTVAALVVLHVGAALKHHFIDLDNTLRRIGF